MFHTEGRFSGADKTRALMFEINSPYMELWTRLENYPGYMPGSEEYPSVNSHFGYTALAGFGLPQAKIILGAENGEFVKGVHLSGENESSTFRTSMVLFHKPPSTSDAFRLDGEIVFEAYSGNSLLGKSRKNQPNLTWGGIFRYECYEPGPMACHSGIAFRRTSNQKSVVEARKKPGGDFLDSFDPAFMNQFKGTSYTTDWSLAVGPTYYFDNTLGANLVLKCHF
jgi:hypothetical protein